MKQLLLICAVVALVGCWKSEEALEPSVTPQAKVKKPLTKGESAKVIETAIRSDLNKPTGELTKADLEKVTLLDLDYFRFRLRIQLTDVKGLEKLTQLKELRLLFNPDLTKAQIDQLQKALPKCEIDSNPTK